MKIRRNQYRLGITLIAIMLPLIISLSFGSQGSANSCGTGTPRDKHQWPFACNSIWNMPIGSNARYRSINLMPALTIAGDVNHYVTISETDPVVPWYRPFSWTNRCVPGDKLHGYLQVPTDLIVPDATEDYRPNNSFAFLQPDGQTLIQGTALARCEEGGSVFGYIARGYPNYLENIYGSGITGGQGGSGLSSIGGTIRLGELLPTSNPIRHALKLNVYAHRYLYDEPPGFRWPAIKVDAYAFDETDPRHYGGENPLLVMGSLLAIPPSVNQQNLRLQTIPGQKLFQALKDYGGYIVDDSARDAHTIAIEKGVQEEFEAAYGYSFKTRSGPFFEDVNRLFQALHVVSNNSAQTIGGGGKPRQPLAPPIGN
jgi:hypothetical protein